MLNGTSLHVKAITQFMILKENIQDMTSKTLKEQNSQMQTSGVSAVHVKIYQLVVQEQVLGGSSPVCSLRLSVALKKEFGLRKRCLGLHSWKTSKTCYQAMKDGTLPKCSFKWTQSGTMSNGQLSTLPMSSLSTGKEYSLSDILEDKVPEEYFLSKDKVKALIENQK